MLAAGIIVFREVLEAALIIGLLLAATRGVSGSRTWISLGILAGLAGSAVLAAMADALSQALSGMGQEAFNAMILMVAVAMLAWHSIWMSRHGREMAAQARAVGQQISQGTRPLQILAVVIGIAVLREGAETVLFLAGIASGGERLAQTALGAAGGMMAGLIVGGGLYAGLSAIPTRHLFGVTTWLVTFLAAGMAAKAVTYLAAAGLIDGGGDILWDSSALLPEGGLMGRILNTLVGYVDRPTPEQMAAWAVTVVLIAGLTRMVGRTNPVR